TGSSARPQAFERHLCQPSRRRWHHACTCPRGREIVWRMSVMPSLFSLRRRSGRRYVSVVWGLARHACGVIAAFSLAASPLRAAPPRFDVSVRSVDLFSGGPTPTYRLALADMDEDGLLDLVSIDEAGCCITIYRGRGHGRFDYPRSFIEPGEDYA